MMASLATNELSDGLDKLQDAAPEQDVEAATDGPYAVLSLDVS